MQITTCKLTIFSNSSKQILFYRRIEHTIK